MKGKVGKTVRILFLALFIFSIFGVREARAMIPLLDGRLHLKGSIDEVMILRTHIPRQEKSHHNSNVGLLLTTARLESFALLVEQEDLKVNLQSIFRYYFEAITKLDREMNAALNPHDRNQFEFPTYFHDDPVNELYLEIIKGPWNVRLGKQIVTWGETALERTSDVVNPLDMRYANPALLPFEDLKIGLWMLRTFYQSQLPGHLLFETIFVPGDHQMMRLYVEGTNWGTGLTNFKDPITRGFGNYLFTMIQNSWKDEAPHRLRNIKNYQWGMRVTGMSAGTSWTLQYYDLVDWLPTGDPDKANQMVYSMIDNFTDYSPTPNVPIPSGIWKYYRTRYVGATCQYYEPNFLQGIIRGEFSWQIGQHYNTRNVDEKRIQIPAWSHDGIVVPATSSKSNSLVTGIVKADGVSYGIAIDRPVLWPWLMQYNDNSKLTLGVQLLQDWIIGHSRDMNISGRGMGDVCRTMVTTNVQSAWRRQEIMTTFQNKYDFTGKGYQVFDFLYAPGDHWRFSWGCLFYWTNLSHTSYDNERGSYDKDCFYFKLKYEW
ncbi:MAG TPA: DUF1302 family protein [Thermodesulfobacteriota bacterium]|nr:DUF1302 family protein [Thermodesulfobacteriota bacterium]